VITELDDRVEVEVQKLLALHPDICRSGAHLVSYFQPGVGKYAVRRIEVFLDRYYPKCAPRARVSPYDDLFGDIYRCHVHTDGQICYMHECEWNPLIHNLAFVFSQSKHIIQKAIGLKGKDNWTGISSLLNQMLY
jgi:hypothetical protein